MILHKNLQFSPILGKIDHLKIVEHLILEVYVSRNAYLIITAIRYSKVSVLSIFLKFFLATCKHFVTYAHICF